VDIIACPFSDRLGFSPTAQSMTWNEVDADSEATTPEMVAGATGRIPQLVTL
jgi:hypothetical protein